MKSKACFLLVTCLMMVMAFRICTCNAFAAESSEDIYRPADIVLVIDTSGSMTLSDQERLVLEAGIAFANMMPSIDSRLGVVGFSDKAITYTKKNRKPAFLEIGDIKNIEDIHKLFLSIKYDGDTGIGLGLHEAVKLFEADSREGVNKAILLFSDGVDDLPQVQYQEAQEQLADSMAWASKNRCPIYSVGFNYRNNDGKGSLDGEGMDRLKRIADTTNAYAVEVNDIKAIERTFTEILETICGVQSNMQKVPGDGKRHEIPIKVPAGAVEMNIRISCNTDKAISSGKIELNDVEGNKVSLANEGNVRFDVEKRSANIKVIKPENGIWTLILDGITGDDLIIGILNHYQIGLQLTSEVPKGNPEGTAYVEDKVKLEVKIVDADGMEMPEACYEDIVAAEAEVQSRQPDAEAMRVKLSYEDGALKGEFVSDGKAAYDVTATVETPYYVKKAFLVVLNGNKPLELTGTEIPNQVVKVRKSIIVPDIYSCVTDKEGDEIKAEIADISNPEAASVAIKGDTMDIKGLKWGSTVVRLVFRDEQNNMVERTFSVKVKDPLKTFLLSMIPVVIGLIVLCIVILGLLRTRRIPGVFSIGPVVIRRSQGTVSIGKLTRVPARIACRGSRSKLYSVIRVYVNMILNQPYLTQEQAETLNSTLAASKDDVFRILSNIELTGTIFGKKGFVLTIPGGMPVKLNSCQQGDAVKMPVMGRSQLAFLIKKTDGTEVKICMTYEQNARS